MKKIVYKSKAIQAVILLTAAILIVSLWPLRLFRETVTVAVPRQEGQLSGMITDHRALLQTIVAQYGHMDSIDVYVGENQEGDSFYVRILNEEQQQVCEELVTIDKKNVPGFQKAMIDIDMEVNKLYYVILQGKNTQLRVEWVYVPMTDTPYLGTMYYRDSSMDGMSLTAKYNYGMPLRKTKVFLWDAVILFVTALSVFAIRQYYKKKEDKLITVEKAFRFALNPLVAAGTLIGLIAVLKGVFGNYTLDNTVYFISVLLLSAILFYGINHNRDGQESILTLSYLKTHAGDIFQSLCFAGAMAACCEYMSGLYDIHHAVAERKEMFFFALAILAMLEWKEILNPVNVIYLAAAGGCGRYYYCTNLTEEMDDLNRQVLKYTVYIAILLGLILIRTGIRLCKKKMTRPSFLYAGLMAVFFALIIIFRNGRWWTVVMAAAFSLFYINYGMWKNKERLLTNVVRGMVFQFTLATGYCLLHRPYVSYRNARYTHIFHTVTITASYLTMIECVAMVMLLFKLKKGRSLKNIWKELVFFGVVSAYMLFTMARTAYFAVGVTALFALLIMSDGKGKERVKNTGKNLLLMLLSAAVLLPVTFTLQRNIPALYSEPFLYEIEYSLYCPEDVMRGRNAASKNFMRVGRFIDVFCEKILSIPEGTFDIYGEIADYQRRHPKLVASLDYQPKDLEAYAPVNEQDIDFMEDIPPQEDYTNGRLDIFRAYMEQLNMTGHEEMGALLQNGEIAVHAHNIYLQVAYDHGIPVGIVFVLFGAVTFIAACLYYHKKKETIKYAALPAVVLTAVAVAGMVEWIYHLSNPCGFLLMLVITPLCFHTKEAEILPEHKENLSL